MARAVVAQANARDAFPVGRNLPSRKFSRVCPNLDINATLGERLSISAIQHFDFDLDFLSVKRGSHSKNAQQKRNAPEMRSPVAGFSRHSTPLWAWISAHSAYLNQAAEKAQFEAWIRMTAQNIMSLVIGHGKRTYRTCEESFR